MGTYNAGYTYYYGRHVFTNAQCRQQPHSDRRPRKRGGGEPLLPLWRAHGRQPQHRPAALQVHRKEGWTATTDWTGTTTEHVTTTRAPLSRF